MIRLWALTGGLAVCGIGAAAVADTVSKDEVKTETKASTTTGKTTTKHDTRTRRSSSDKKPVAADDTGINQRDRAEGEPTADQQKNNKSDVALTAEIRRAVVKESALSTNAHNIKIIVVKGHVTLKGPVASAAEKASVEKKANEIAGPEKVTSEIDIAP